MTVFVYVNTSKQVGDADHIKVFANIDAAETLVRGKRSGGRSVRIMRFWSEPDRPPHHPVHRGARGDLHCSVNNEFGLTRIPDSRRTSRHGRKVPIAIY
jgi:hypothetical protein